MLCRWLFICGCIFLSTPSARRATDMAKEQAARTMISIHALREEGDSNCGARGGAVWVFLSTPSARRATSQDPCYHGKLPISIHALREEGDIFCF